MERLFKVSYLLVLLLSLWPQAARGQSACSLIVRALSSDGRRPEAAISVVEKSGRIEEKYQEDEDVRFCDLGILPVTVTVGSEGLCNQVTVHNVPVTLDESYLLHVTYDPLPCGPGVHPPTPICSILFRVADADGWISGARIDLTSPTRDRLTADEFGRALFTVENGARVSGTVTAPGHQSATFNWACSVQTTQHEEHVQLSR